MEKFSESHIIKEQQKVQIESNQWENKSRYESHEEGIFFNSLHWISTLKDVHFLVQEIDEKGKE
jgi:hypothetical protein